MGGNSVKTKIYRFDTHHHHYKEEKQPEGKITINPNIPKSKSTNDRNLGEYVDYEEVK